MNGINKIIIFVVLLAHVPAYAEWNELDLQGDGVTTKVWLPFKYLHREKGVRYDLIVEGAYQEYDLIKNENKKVVSIIGPTHPCLGIVVASDKKMIAFHINAANDSSDIAVIVAKAFPDVHPKDLLVRIYGTLDPAEERRTPCSFSVFPQLAAFTIKYIFTTVCGVPEQNIAVNLFPICVQKNNVWCARYGGRSLGRYLYAEFFIAVKLSDVFIRNGNQKQQIQLFSIDPFSPEINLFNVCHEKSEKDWRDFHQQNLYSDLVYWCTVGKKFQDYLNSFPRSIGAAPLINMTGFYQRFEQNVVVTKQQIASYARK